MTQISKGDTFADGQQVTGARLNQLVDASTLLVGAITDQTAITAATVAIDDSVILSDTSASALRKATVGDILGSSLPVVASIVTATTVTSSAVNAGANNDVVVTPYDGTSVTGKTFISADGITNTVTSVAHGLLAGSIVNITASNTAYSGQYVIAVPTVDTFTYSVYPTTTSASGTCSYVRKATKRTVGNTSISGNSDIAGNETIAGNLRVLGTTKAYLTTDSTAITQTTGDNSTKVATTAFVTATISAAPVIKAFTKNTGTTLNAQFNIASVTNASIGSFVYTFTTALADANYVVNATAFVNINYNYYCMVTAMSTTGFTIQVGYAVSYGGAFVAVNPTSMLVSVIR